MLRMVHTVYGDSATYRWVSLPDLLTGHHNEISAGKAVFKQICGGAIILVQLQCTS